jgi:hypothetical protein
MSFSRPSLKIEVAWFDDDLLELQLSAVSADFSGRANFYAALNEPGAFAGHIAGFPKSSSDVKEYEFGGTNMPGYGGAKIRLFCRDGSGHLGVEVSIYKNRYGTQEVAESAMVELGAVPAEIDAFVLELQRMKLQVGETAVLQGAA